jgi:Flp pilus assembly protein TadD
MDTQQQPNAAWASAMQAGVQRYQSGQLEAAAQAFNEAVKLSPDRFEGWANLGSALADLRHLDEAAAALQKAIRLNPRNFIPQMVLGDVLRQLGRWNDAMACYQQAVALDRAPIALNKLACALRAERQAEEAEKLYQEALQKEPGFTLAKVNLATTYIELGRFEQARAQLNALAGSRLPADQRAEAESASLMLSEYFRLEPVIASMGPEGTLATLVAELHNTPERLLQADEAVLGQIRRYAESAARIPLPASPDCVPLPGEWPLIEAMFMIPMVNSSAEYREIRSSLNDQPNPSGDLLESANMEHVIDAVRTARHELQDPVKAEAHVRHWHWLACQGVSGYLPGHFKYTQNQNRTDPEWFRRGAPTRVSGTLRHFISNVYGELTPGLPRAAVVLLAICDLHPLADGNGRIALAWLNRELEWAGLMPALFRRETGFRGKLNQAMWKARKGEGLAALYSVIAEGQHYAREFLAELGHA